MSKPTRNPQNTNPILPNKFSVNFARMPNLTYFCQTVSLPGLSMGEAIRNTPFIDLYSPGDKLIYDLLTFTFMVDENLQSWLEIHDWIRAMAFPTDFQEYRNLPRLNRVADSREDFPQFSDATLNILTSSYNQNYKVKFADCFPISLSAVTFSSTDSPDNFITADVSFRFSYFNIEKS